MRFQRSVLPLRQICIDNLKIVVGNMLNSGPPFTSPSAHIPGTFRLEPGIYFDKAGYVCLDTCLFQAESSVLGCRPMATRRCDP